MEMTNAERIQAHNDALRECIATAENLPDAGGGTVAEPVIEQLEITENGIYTAPDGIDGYSPVVVTVPIPDEYIIPSGVKNITENGDHDVKEFESVSVAVPVPDGYIQPSGTLEIADNGEHDVTEYAFVNVNVPIAGGGGDNTFTQLYETGALENSKITEVPNDFCRGWNYLKKINLPNVTQVGSYVFYNCSNLTEVNLPNCTELGGYGFYNCAKLAIAHCENIASVGGSVFRGCAALTNLRFLEATRIGTYGFRACTKLERIDFAKLSSIGNNAFLESSALTAVIIRTNEVCTMSNKNAFSDTSITSGTGYIYVPAVLVDRYKGDTNWSTYANQIRAIEDYPEICGG